jgi:hypothetical protein
MIPLYAVLTRISALLWIALLIAAVKTSASAQLDANASVYLPLVAQAGGGQGTAPVIHSFVADPAIIAPGGQSTLRWNVSGAAALSISGIGAVTGSSVNVSPAATTVYVLTAANASGSAIAQTTVTVEESSGSAEANFFLPNAPGGSYVTTGQPRMAIDANGGVHVIYAARTPDITEVRPAYYAYCPGDCASADDFTTVSMGYLMSYGQLALDPAGHPRVLLNAGAPDGKVHYLYGECNGRCTNPNQWALADVAIAQPSLVAASIEQNQFFALDAQGRPRFFYYSDAFGVEDPNLSGTFYAQCDGDCTNPAQWVISKITDKEWRYVALAFTPGANSQPRIAISLKDEERYAGLFAYLECDGECATPENWNGTVLARADDNYYPSGAVYALRIDSKGRPRIAIQPWQAYATGIGLNLGYLSYLTCDANCQQFASWRAVDLGQEQMDGEGGVDLVLDSQDRPRIAYRIPRVIWEPAYAWCDSNCESSAEGWQTLQIPTTALAQEEWPFLAMQGCPFPECNPPIPKCTGAFWDAGYWPSLALDPAGNPRIAFDMRHVHTGGGCPGGSFVRWSRFVSFDQPH